MNGIDYCLKLYKANGDSFLGRLRYESLASAREIAVGIVQPSPLHEVGNATVKVEVLAGDAGCSEKYFDIVVETYRRTAPLFRAGIANIRWTCAGMRY